MFRIKYFDLSFLHCKWRTSQYDGGGSLRQAMWKAIECFGQIHKEDTCDKSFIPGHFTFTYHLGRYD